MYSCSTCRTHAAYHDDTRAKGVRGLGGRAGRLADGSNGTVGDAEDRGLRTGVRSGRAAPGRSGNSLMGGKYERAYGPGQKDKEGKFVIEKAGVTHEGGW